MKKSFILLVGIIIAFTLNAQNTKKGKEMVKTTGTSGLLSGLPIPVVNATGSVIKTIQTMDKPNNNFAAMSNIMDGETRTAVMNPDSVTVKGKKYLMIGLKVTYWDPNLSKEVEQTPLPFAFSMSTIVLVRTGHLNEDFNRLFPGKNIDDYAIVEIPFKEEAGYFVEIKNPSKGYTLEVGIDGNTVTVKPGKSGFVQLSDLGTKAISVGVIVSNDSLAGGGVVYRKNLSRVVSSDQAIEIQETDYLPKPEALGKVPIFNEYSAPVTTYCFDETGKIVSVTVKNGSRVSGRFPEGENIVVLSRVKKGIFARVEQSLVISKKSRLVIDNNSKISAR